MVSVRILLGNRQPHTAVCVYLQHSLSTMRGLPGEEMGHRHNRSCNLRAALDHQNLYVLQLHARIMQNFNLM